MPQLHPQDRELLDQGIKEDLITIARDHGFYDDTKKRDEMIQEALRRSIKFIADMAHGPEQGVAFYGMTAKGRKFKLKI